ncbi:hypothetical protein [Halalkalibacter okhensis]|uniref:Uncharacterized protein n=1 Tax=Halalkalibacter okhensis TaxID=333138 RepID=A0A0B0ICT5_9BACI|nr:hypothetical protein [Halalkalibacter okhensis]KHF39125.1 hypothetical protein LQ50_16970 [Halalkalibacter okhensis]
MRKQKRMLLIILVIMLSTNLSHTQVFAKKDQTLPINIEEETGHGIELIDTAESTYYNLVKDIVYTYEIKTKPASYLTVTKRMIDRDDHFIFTTLDNQSDQAVELSFSIPVADTGYYSLQSLDQFITGPRFNDAIHVDLTTHPFGLLTTYKENEFSSNVMIGKQYHSRKITDNYEDGRKSVMREFLSENQNFDIDSKEDELLFKMDMRSKGEDILDHWLVFSKERLFDSEDSFTEWAKIYHNKKRKHNNWYTAEGPYKKVGKSAEPAPASKLQYARNLLIVREDEALTRYKETEERYFRNIMLNSLANLTIFKDGKDYWETEYTNHWLNRRYGIEAPYIDTRHNEKVALYLEEVGKIFDIPELRTAIIDYADFLVKQIEAEQVVKVAPDAYLISDYFTYYQDTAVTHSSLNHVLGGMNLLLQTYVDTDEEKYLQAATFIQNGIDELGDQWLNDQGDTWYQINPDHSFQGEDYPILTLTDLLISLQLWKEVDDSRIHTIEMLAQSKANYLVNKGVSLPKEVIRLLDEHEIEFGK